MIDVKRKQAVISVVVPLYNKAETILSTVASVFNQTYVDFELIVVDDGSTDDGVSRLASISDSRFRLYSKQNGGVSDARNFGAENSVGEFIFFLDADDTLEENCLELLYQLTIDFPEQSVFSANFRSVRAHGCGGPQCKGLVRGVIDSPMASLWQGEIFLRTGNMLIRRECWDALGGFNKNLSFFEDMEHVLDLVRRYSVVFDPSVVLSYHLDSNHLSTRRVPLSEDWTYVAVFKGKSHCEKMIIGTVVYSSLVKRWRSRQYSDFFALMTKHFLYLHYVIGGKVIKKLQPFFVVGMRGWRAK